ncbi:cytochrome c oxidase copper chaperone-like protein [Phycomyces nitens]|nr:cytochrome c oxidase copper chaperone-like protein [Phycomyces nitens]
MAESTSIKTNLTTSGTLPLDAQGKPIKPCCACPETKKPRDLCIFEKGEENCQELIKAHIECMRKLGFKV